MVPTVVLIPGLICNQVAWLDVAERLLKRGVKTFVSDPGTSESIEAMAAKILSDVPGQLIPIGHSMGGRVALELYRQAPGRVLGLGLIATGAHPLAEGETEKRQAVIDLANSEGMHALVSQWLPPMLAKGYAEKSPQRYQTLFASCESAGAEQHERQIRALMKRPNALPLLAEITCPTLLVAGIEDAWSTPGQHHDMQDLLVNSQTRLEILNTGHFVQYEAPDRFSDLAFEWINSLK